MPKVYLKTVYPTCGTCTHFEVDDGEWEKEKDDREGWCYRNPPQIFEGLPTGRMPVVGYYECACGEYEVRGMAIDDTDYENLFELMPKEVADKLKSAFESSGRDNIDDAINLFHEMAAEDDDVKAKESLGLAEKSWAVHACIQLSRIDLLWDELLEETKQYRQDNFDEFWEYLS